LTRTFLDAGLAGTHARVGFVVLLLFVLPPALYLAARVATDEAASGARFSNEIVADARKDVMWGVCGMGFLGMLLGGGLWMAHRNRHAVRVAVDDDGILYHSMFREVRASWSDLLGFEKVVTRRAGSYLRVRTRRGTFMVPPTMVEASRPLPEVVGGLDGPRILHPDGREESPTPEDNALFRAIREGLAASRPAGGDGG
jgi:hypothetical protein